MPEHQPAILAVDTSASGCSAALLYRGEVAERLSVAPRQHTRLLMPMIRELLADAGLAIADLDALAFARGPGSFAGIRIATGVVQGLAWAADRPVVPVSSLAAVASAALAAGDSDQVAVAFDARMNEVYWCCYQRSDTGPKALCDEQVLPPGELVLPNAGGSWMGVGSGWTTGDVPGEGMPREVVAAMSAIEGEWIPRASDVVRLAARALAEGEAVSAARAQPVYVRDEVTWQKLPGR